MDRDDYVFEEFRYYANQSAGLIEDVMHKKEHVDHDMESMEGTLPLLSNQHSMKTLGSKPHLVTKPLLIPSAIVTKTTAVAPF